MKERPFYVLLEGGHGHGLKVKHIKGEQRYCHCFHDSRGRYHQTTYEFYKVDFERRIVHARPSTKRLRALLAMED